MGSIPSEDTLTGAKKQLAEEGWCVVPNAISEEKAKKVLDRLWKAAEESKKRGVDTYMPQLDPNESNIRVFYLMELDEIFRELIQDPTAIEMVKEVLGGNFLVRVSLRCSSFILLTWGRSVTSRLTLLDLDRNQWVCIAINLLLFQILGRRLGH